jgi:hypothetical protein
MHKESAENRCCDRRTIDRIIQLVVISLDMIRGCKGLKQLAGSQHECGNLKLKILLYCLEFSQVALLSLAVSPDTLFLFSRHATFKDIAVCYGSFGSMQWS